MNRHRLLLVLGLAHAVADGTAGWLLGTLSFTAATSQLAALVVVYNVLAFALQPFFGLLADRFERPQAATVAGLLLLVAAVAVFRLDAPISIGLAGLGSGLFHVGGGALALRVSRGRAAGPGVFAAPGVVGLACGGAAAVAGIAMSGPLAAALVGLTAATVFACSGVADGAESSESAVPSGSSPDRHPVFETHDVIMILLLAAIALRSFVWSTLQIAWDGHVSALVGLAIAAGCGKLAGGWLADRIGWRRWAIGALAGSTPLLALGEKYPPLMFAGVALLQSATPVTLAAAARILPAYPATAAGLALGLAIAAGGLPLAALGPTWGPDGMFTWVAALVSAALVWRVIPTRLAISRGRRIPAPARAVAILIAIAIFWAAASAAHVRVELINGSGFEFHESASTNSGGASA